MEVDRNVTEILRQAGDGEEIILEPEGEYDGEFEEEIVEIIEEYEEVEDENEFGQVEQLGNDERYDQQQYVGDEVQEGDLVQTSNGTYVYKEVEGDYNAKELVYTTAQELVSNQEKSNNQFSYDASADWGDEDYEQEAQPNEEEDIQEQTTDSQDYNTYPTYDNGVDAAAVDNDERIEHAGEEEEMEFEQQHENQTNIVDEDSNQQEIIQNSENNLIYTVLGPKKQAKLAQNKNSDPEFVEVQRYRDEHVPDGTIYYAVNDEDGTYVQAVEEDQEQYQYANEQPATEQENQEWEVPEQNVEDQQETAQEQEQIFLHEDENGQLYYKNDQGELQPVYITPDGNYAIAENSEDEQESQEDANQIQEEQVAANADAEQEVDQEEIDAEADNYVLPDLDLKPFLPKKRSRQAPPEDDDTVTISLIISEDEHGQKRTQVIIPSPAQAKCDICKKTFKSSLQLLKHNRLKHAREEDITTRNFPCDLCPKRFTDQNSLARHRKTHVESRPFQCLECHKSFPTANTLRKHLSLHNPDSHPLPCIYCGRRFLDKPSLTKHEQSHLAAETKMHICDICQKCFSNVNDLNIHKKNHDPDRKFDCEVCGREFNRLNNLQRHMMVHQQVNLDVDTTHENIPGKEKNSYNGNRSLTTSKQGGNTPEEVLSCNVCGITYKFSSSLTRHMVTTHMNPEKLRQQAEEQRRKRETNYRRYLENRKTYETQQPKHTYRRSTGRLMDDQDEDDDDEAV